MVNDLNNDIRKTNGFGNRSFKDVAEPFTVVHFREWGKFYGEKINPILENYKKYIRIDRIVSILMDEMESLYFLVREMDLFPDIVFGMNDGWFISDEFVSSMIQHMRKPYNKDEDLKNGTENGLNRFWIFTESNFESFIDEVKFLLNIQTGGKKPGSEIDGILYYFFMESLKYILNEGILRSEILFYSWRLNEKYDFLFKCYVKAAYRIIADTGKVHLVTRVFDILNCRMRDPRPEISSFARDMKRKIQALNGEMIPYYSKYVWDQIYFARSQFIHSENDNALTETGVAFAKIKKFAEAMVLLSDALRINPENPQALRNYGLLISTIGFEKEAPGYLNKVLETSNNWNELARRDLAWIAEKANNMDVCLNQYRSIMQTFTDLSDGFKLIICRFYIRTFLKHGYWEEAEDVLNALESLNYDDSDLNNQLVFWRIRLALGMRKNYLVKDLLERIAANPDKYEIEDLQWLIKTLSEKGMQDELRFLSEAVFEKFEYYDKIYWLAYFHLVWINFRRFAEENHDPVLEQLISFFSNDQNSEKVHEKFLNEIQADRRLGFLLVLNGKLVVQNRDQVPDGNLARIARSVLVPDSFHVNEIVNLLKIWMELGSPDILPWPEDHICLCGTHLRSQVFSECGYQFEKLSDEFFLKRPAQLLVCPECGQTIPGIKCDVCNRVYTWFF